MAKKPKRLQKDVRFRAHDDLPASVGFVKEVREELRSEIQSVRHEVGALRHELHKEAGSLREDMNALKHELKGDIAGLATAVHRTQVLMEEQRSENRIVLDGLKTVLDRQDRIETDVAEIRTAVKALGAPI